METKEKSKSVVIGILVVLLILAIAVILYFIVINNKVKIENNETTTPNQNSNMNTDNSNTTQLISTDIKEYITTEDVISDLKSDIYVIGFQNVNTSAVKDFKDKQKEFVKKATNDETNKAFTNVVITNIIDNILSVYTKELIMQGGKGDAIEISSSSYAVSIDLKTKDKLSTTDILKRNNIQIIDAAKAILNYIASTSNVDTFLKSTTGDVTAETVSMTDFKKNIDTYAATIASHIDSYVVYYENNSINCDFQVEEVLMSLGLGTHMGVGIKQNTQTIVIK
ncbi:MAG: hypothetical protein PHP54_02240 [Clostridia bacterium]|nr:hypothetical protein [Clostridia bacterium]